MTKQVNKNTSHKFRTDIPLTVLILLATLAVPRVVVHDLRLLDFDSLPYKILAITPLAVWAVVAIVRRTSRPIYDFMVLGLLFGFMLALTHQIAWDASWGSNVPHLGGNLAGKLDPTIEGLLLRTAAFISSIITGLVTGAMIAALAYVTSRLRGKVK